MFNLLEIKDPTFLKKLSIKELKILCEEIRQFIIENVAVNGGHLSSNLGDVELIVGMLYVFDNPNDKFIFDVGHQTYTYKILTGRAKEFSKLRKKDGLSGFINYDESKYDVWESGHSSTSISAMSGFLIAKNNGENINDVVTLIGDASISNGEAFEGLNFISTFKDNHPIIILNDNGMSISKLVGGTSKTFEALRRSKFYHGFKAFLNFIFPEFITKRFHRFKRGVKAFLQHDNYFEDLNLDYFGPYNGNDLKQVIKTFKRAKDEKGPVVLHFETIKGKGYKFAEEDEVGSYHGLSSFDISTGKCTKVWKENEHSYSDIVAKKIIDLKNDKQIVCVTPAMIVGSRLKKLKEKFPNSVYDVGIAEEHAASMCAALALNNQKPILFMYSTFAQRAYDQILNDISRRKLDVLICIDRAGFVSGDGSTHQGIYDVAMFNTMPNIVIAQGKDLEETCALLEYLSHINFPCVLRFAKRSEIYQSTGLEIIDMSWQVLRHSESKNVIISYSYDVLNILDLVEKNNLDVEVVNARFINPIDCAYLLTLENKNVIVYETVVENNSLYSLMNDFFQTNNISLNLIHMAIPQNAFVDLGNVEELKKEFNLDDASILEELKKICD